MSRLPKPSGLPAPRTGIPRPGYASEASGIPGPSRLRPPGSQIPSTPSVAGAVPTIQVNPPTGSTRSASGASGIPASGSRLRPPGSQLPATQSVGGVPTVQFVPSTETRRGLVGGPSGSRLTAPRGIAPRSSGTKFSTSETKLTVVKPSGSKTITKKESTTVVKPVAKQSKPKIGESTYPKRAPLPVPPPSALRKQVTLQVKAQTSKAPVGSTVTAVAAKRSRVPPLGKIVTPAGQQQVLEKVITEKRVERTKAGEVVSKNIKTMRTDPTSRQTIQVEQEAQKLNPNFPVSEGPVKEVVTIISEKDITENYETTKQNVIKEITKLDAGLGIDPIQVSQLVEEEKEDVQNTLAIGPPELVNQPAERYPMKKKLQALRLSPANVALLEQSLVQPPITADEALPEPTPEVMAQVLDAMDRSMKPRMQPEATFHSLFEGGTGDPSSAMVNISPVAPGPLADVVVPNQSVPEVMQEEMLSKGMEEVAIVVQTAEEKPLENSFSAQPPSKPKRKIRRKKTYRPLSNEQPPWSQNDLPEVSSAVGALPKENLLPCDVTNMEISKHLHDEFDKGIEYFLDFKPLQYCSRVQLRGSQPPPWFPGYIYALSDMSDGVEVAKSPSQVLFAAWKSVQPEMFPEDSIVYN